MVKVVAVRQKASLNPSKQPFLFVSFKILTVYEPPYHFELVGPLLERAVGGRRYPLDEGWLERRHHGRGGGPHKSRGVGSRRCWIFQHVHDRPVSAQCGHRRCCRPGSALGAGKFGPGSGQSQVRVRLTSWVTVMVRDFLQLVLL